MNQHTNYITIDLDAVDGNFEAIRAKAGCDVLTVVKADGYGHGAVPLARFLESRSAFFGVASAGEALDLRRGGIEKPILILGRTATCTYAPLIAHRIRPTIFRWDDAQALSAEAVRLGVEVPFHFAVDTGMSRIGVTADPSGADLCQRIAALPGLLAEGIFSHYATADEADLSRAAAQSQLFDEFLGLLKDRGVRPRIVHLSNSAGIMNFGAHHNMVRAGIVLHGIYPSADVAPEKLPIRPTLSWHSHIAHLQTLPAGRQIGYGGTYTTTGPTRVATVPVGYADGYRRELGGKFSVLIRGQTAPILGRVCMDQMMVDVTHIPEAAPDDPVVLIGRQGDREITMDQMAAAARTISYEIMCGLSRRTPRLYTRRCTVVEEVSHFPEE